MEKKKQEWEQNKKEEFLENFGVINENFKKIITDREIEQKQEMERREKEMELDIEHVFHTSRVD